MGGRTLIGSLEPRRLFAATVTEAGALEITGSDGNDRIRVSRRGDSVVVREKRQVSRFAASGVQSVSVFAMDGNDRVDCRSVDLPCRINGQHGNDVLVGGRADDRLDGGGGNDRLFGSAGRDRLTDARGDDRHSGGPDDDVLVDHSGTNRFTGGRGADLGAYLDGQTRTASVETTSPTVAPTPVQPHAASATAVVRPDSSGAWLTHVTVNLPGSGYAVAFGSLTRSGSQFTLPITIERYATGGVDITIPEREAFLLPGVEGGGNFTLVITAADGTVITTVPFLIPIPATA